MTQPAGSGRRWVVERVRPAGAADLAGINGLVTRAVMGWSLPERVKRLALPTYLYTAADLTHLTVVVATDEDGGILGVAAWEPAEERDAPPGRSALLLHGLYVDPPCQGRGVGARLLAAAVEAASKGGCDGLLVKAQPDASGFFEAAGLMRLPVADSGRDYPYRYWQPIEHKERRGNRSSQQ